MCHRNQSITKVKSYHLPGTPPRSWATMEMTTARIVLILTTPKLHLTTLGSATMNIYQKKNSSVKEGCTILQQIYTWHCIVLYPPNNRLTIQYNREWSNKIDCNTMPCINLSEYWTILQLKWYELLLTMHSIMCPCNGYDLTFKNSSF